MYEGKKNHGKFSSCDSSRNLKGVLAREKRMEKVNSQNCEGFLIQGENT